MIDFVQARQRPLTDLHVIDRFCARRPVRLAVEGVGDVDGVASAVIHFPIASLDLGEQLQPREQKGCVRSKPPFSIHTAWRFLLQRQG